MAAKLEQLEHTSRVSWKQIILNLSIGLLIGLSGCYLVKKNREGEGDWRDYSMYTVLTLNWWTEQLIYIFMDGTQSIGFFFLSDTVVLQLMKYYFLLVYKLFSIKYKMFTTAVFKLQETQF